MEPSPSIEKRKSWWELDNRSDQGLGNDWWWIVGGFIAQRCGYQSDFETKYILRCSGFWSIETALYLNDPHLSVLRILKVPKYVTCQRWEIGAPSWNCCVVECRFKAIRKCVLEYRKKERHAQTIKSGEDDRWHLTRIINISRRQFPNFFDIWDCLQWKVFIHRNMSKLWRTKTLFVEWIKSCFISFRITTSAVNRPN